MDDMTPSYITQPPPPPLSDIFPPHHPHHHDHPHYYPPSRHAYLEPPLSPAPPPVPLHYINHNHPPSPPIPPYSPSYDEVRTLFIAGLPEDVKPREIYHLFRDFPGYVSSNLRTSSRNSLPFAFAVFADQPSAVAARHELNGMVFDLEKGSTLHIDLAKSNSRSKRQRTGGERSGSDKKRKVSSGYPGDGVESGFGSFHIPGTDNSSHNLVGYAHSQSNLSFDSRGICETGAAQSAKSPCPTIFVGSLGPKCSEKELHSVFSRCRGFLKLKIQSTYGSPVAFVDFKDTACSTEALIQLQGTVLHSSPAGEGLRLEYAKSRMGKRRRAK